MNPIAIVMLALTMMFGSLYAAVTLNPYQSDKGTLNVKQ